MMYFNSDLSPSEKLKRAVLGHTLDSHLQRGANNYDLLRLILALLVIYGHTPVFYPGKSWTDIVTLVLGFSYSGGLAVAVFFVLSGIFVTESIRKTASLSYFAIRRILRIYPALLVCLVFLALVIGPAFSTLGIQDYFSQPDVWSYIFKNLKLTHEMQWRIPSLFESSKHGLNGSLWTLPTELRLYVCVAAVFLMGSYGSGLSATIATMLVMTLFLNDLFPEWRVFGESIKLVYLFFFGSLLSIHKKHIPISWPVALALAAVPPLLKSTAFYHIAWYVVISYWLLYLFSLKPLRRLTLPGDYSYGVYLYGFPLQNVVAALLPNASLAVGCLVASVASLGLGAASWHLVERPCNRLGSLLQAMRMSVVPKDFPWQRLARAAVPLALAVLGGATIAFVAPQMAAPTELRITTYGPDTIMQGEGFNIQPNGSSAIWVRVSRPIQSGAKLMLDGHELVTTVVGDLLTAPVPPELYSTSGIFPLTVVEEDSKQKVVSPPANWTVRGRSAEKPARANKRVKPPLTPRSDE